MFRAWAAHVPEWVEVRAVWLPGRPGRHREPPFTDVGQAVDALLDGLGPELTDRYALVGHSMGAMLAYRMTQALRERGGRLPGALAVASWPPRGASRRVMPDPAGSDEAFTADLRRLGGIPDELLDDPVMTKVTLPLLRADFQLCRSYAYRPAAPLSMPLIALGGVADTVTPPETLATWREEAADFRGLNLFPGGHFFLADHVPEVVGLVIQAVRASHEPREGAHGLPTLPR